MDPFTMTDLLDLMGDFESPCVSIYLPTHRAGQDIQQDPIRLKNLVREAKSKLKKFGVRTQDAEDLLKPAMDLQQQVLFWQHMDHGLAIFLAPGVSRFYRLPVSFREEVVVAEDFRIRPLLPYFQEEGLFYILAISLHQVRLLECSRHACNEIEVPDIPKSIDEIMANTEFEKAMQYRAGATLSASPAGGQRSAAFVFGSGSGGDQTRHKGDILRFFHEVDKGVSRTIKHPDAPLVFAGVDYLMPIYQEANTHRHFLDKAIQGNPELRSNDDLHREAWPLVQDCFQSDQDREKSQYYHFKGSARASNDIRAILPAANQGRVQALFIASNQDMIGSFDASSFEVEQIAEAGDLRGKDLLDACAVQTLEHGGKVYSVEQDNLVDESVCSALFRY